MTWTEDLVNSERFTLSERSCQERWLFSESSPVTYSTICHAFVLQWRHQCCDNQLFSSRQFYRARRRGDFQKSSREVPLLVQTGRGGLENLTLLVISHQISPGFHHAKPEHARDARTAALSLAVTFQAGGSLHRASWVSPERESRRPSEPSRIKQIKPHKLSTTEQRAHPPRPFRGRSQPFELPVIELIFVGREFRQIDWF